MIDQKRMTYIPHPPSLKCFHAAAIERPPSGFFVGSALPLRIPELFVERGRRRVLLASELVVLERCHPRPTHARERRELVVASGERGQVIRTNPIEASATRRC